MGIIFEIIMRISEVIADVHEEGLSATIKRHLIFTAYVIVLFALFILLVLVGWIDEFTIQLRTLLGTVEPYR